MFISYNLEAFGEKLKELRRDLGYSQRELEKQSGISSDTLRRIEKERSSQGMKPWNFSPVSIEEDLAGASERKPFS